MTKDNAHLYLPLVQALADKKTIQYFKAEWVDMPEIDFSGQASRYRIKPTPALIPLGPEDVPPGSVFRSAAADKALWFNPIQVTLRGLDTDFEGENILWVNLMEYEIKRPNQDWQPCSKQAPEA